MSTRAVRELMDAPVQTDLGPDAAILPQPVGPAGIGSPNVQPFQSGHTNAMPVNPAAEVGFGKPPGWGKWGHYPRVEDVNPYRNAGNYLRYGQDAGTLTYRPERAAYWVSALDNEAQWAQGYRKARSPVSPIIEDPLAVPFTETVMPISQRQRSPV